MASLRGLGAASTRIELDGVRLMNPSTGSFDLSVLPPAVLSSALISGASTFTSTASAPGGTISLDSGAATTSSVTFSTGSFGSLNLNGEGNWSSSHRSITSSVATTRYEGDFPYQDPLSSTRSQIRRLDSDRQSISGFLSVRQEWPSGPNDGESSASSHPVALQVTLLGSEVNRGIPALANAVAPGARQDDTFVLASVGLSGSFADMPINVRLSTTRSTFHYRPERTDSLRSRVAEYVWTTSASRVLGHSWIAAFDVEARHARVHNRQRTQQNEASARLSLERVVDVGSIALKMQGVRQRSEASVPVSAPTSNRTHQRISPSLHLSSRSWDRLLTGFSLGTVYRLPTLNERFWEPGGSPDLEPEKGWQAEGFVAATVGPEIAPIRARLTAFMSHINDRISWRPALSGNARHIWTADNIAQVRGRGVEMVLDWEPATHWKVSSSAAVIDQRDHSNPLAASYGNRLRYTTPHTGGFEVEHNRDRWGAFIAWHHTGRRFTATDESQWLDAFSELDLGMQARLRFGKVPIRVATSLLNVTNRSRESSPWMPMPGREWHFSITLLPTPLFKRPHS